MNTIYRRRLPIHHYGSLSAGQGGNGGGTILISAANQTGRCRGTATCSQRYFYGCCSQQILNIEFAANSFDSRHISRKNTYFNSKTIGVLNMSESTAEKISRDDILRMVVEVVAAYVGKNSVPASQIPDLIHTVFDSLNLADGQTPEVKAEVLRPAVSIKRSVTPEFIICLEDGKKLKMLKRHLRTTYNMTPDDYRAKWSLPPDYPMVAPNYAAQRSEFAKKIGLGRTASATVERRGRRPRVK